MILVPFFLNTYDAPGIRRSEGENEDKYDKDKYDSLAHRRLLFETSDLLDLLDLQGSDTPASRGLIKKSCDTLAPEGQCRRNMD